jgi:hypothetical protein
LTESEVDDYNAEIVAGPSDFFYLGSLVRLLLSEARDLLALNRLLKPVPAGMPEFAPQADNMLAALARILPRVLATLDDGSAALAYFPMQNALAKEFQQSMRARVEALYKELVADRELNIATHICSGAPGTTRKLPPLQQWVIIPSS